MCKNKYRGIVLQIYLSIGITLFFISKPTHAADLTWNHSLQKGCDPSLIKAYKGLTDARPIQTIPTQGFSIERPGLKLALGKGELGLEMPSHPAIKGLFYSGSGTISFSVDDSIERNHLKMFIKKESISAQVIDSVYFLPLGECADLPSPLPVSDEYTMVEGEYAKFKNALHVNGCMTLASLFNGHLHDSGDIAVLFRMGERIWAYIKDSTSEEEVQLLRLANPPMTDSWWWDAVVSLHLEPDGQMTPVHKKEEVKAKYITDIQRYDVNYRFNHSGDVEQGSYARLQISLSRPLNALLLKCSPLLVISSVRDSQGVNLPFLLEEYSKRNETVDKGLLIHFPKPAEGELQIEIGITADLFDNEMGFLALRDEDDWYPNAEDWDGAQFSFTADVPKGMEAVTVGDLARQETGPGGRVVWSYEMNEKIRLATLLLGKFTHKKQKAEGVEVDVILPDCAEMAIHGQSTGVTLQEVSNALKVYTAIYGPLPYKVLRVGLIRGGHGRGFPSMLLIASGAFIRAGTTWQDRFLAHETAHQWWYNRAAPLTYRDSWVSEALAEFSSLIYSGQRYGMPKVKFYLADDMQGMLRISTVLKSPLVEQGPICLGPRLFTTLDPDSGYQTIIYNKGAWVLLNLLRLSAYLKEGEKGFYEGLKKLIAITDGGRISGLDLQRAIESGLKYDLDWYFKQWLESSMIPKVSVNTEVNGDGQDLRLLVHGRQDSEMTLPIPIQIEQGRQSREYMFFLKGKSGSQEFPMPFKPEKVTVDGNHLCPVEYR